MEPRVEIDAGMSDVSAGKTEAKLVVGIISFANYSSLNESGVRGVLLSDIHDWINQISTLQVL